MKLLSLLMFLALAGCSADKMALNLLYPAPKAAEDSPILAEKTGESPVILYYHGNGTDLKLIEPILERLNTYGHVIAHEYPGYGNVEGDPNEAEFLAKLRLDLLNAKVDHLRKDVVLLGRSLGAAVASQLAQEGVDKLILISPWTSAKAAAENSVSSNFIFRMLFKRVSDDFWRKHEWNSLEAVSKFDGPALVIHGKEDKLIPFSHGEQIAAALGVKITAIEGAGHNDIFTKAELWSAVQNFLEK